MAEEQVTKVTKRSALACVASAATGMGFAIDLNFHAAWPFLFGALGCAFVLPTVATSVATRVRRFRSH